MTAYDRRRERQIETPVGDVIITEKMWNEGEDDEHWAHIQTLNPEVVREDVSTGEILAHFVKQYTIAYQLMQEGYEMYGQIDAESLMWVNFK